MSISKTSAPSTVAGVIKSLTTTACNDLAIKGKFYTDHNNPQHVTGWWFVIRGRSCLTCRRNGPLFQCTHTN